MNTNCPKQKNYHLFLWICFLLVMPCVSYAQEAEMITPDSNWFPEARVRNSESAPATFDLPPTSSIWGYVPVLSFQLHLQDDSIKSVPELSINSLALPATDKKALPRLLNRKNALDGGSGHYLFNLNDLLHPTVKRRLSINLGNGNTPFRVTDIKLFYKTETRSTIPDKPFLQKNAFRIHPGKTLRVDFNGKPFITAESVSGLPALETLQEQEQLIYDSTGAIVAHNLIHLGDKMADFRREAFLTPEGELELSFRAAYKQAQKNNEGYCFTIPAELLDRADYEFRFGNGNAYNSIKGKFDFSSPGPANRIFYDAETNKIHTYLHYLFITKGDMKLVLDFSPMGECSVGSYQICNRPPGMVSFVHRYGNKVVFGLTKYRKPERISNIVRIYSGEYDYYYRHGNTMVGYYNGAFLDNLGYRISFAEAAETARRNAALPEYPWWRDTYQMPFQSALRTVDYPELLPVWKSLPEKATHFKGGPHFPNASGLLIPGGSAEYELPLEAGIYMCSLITGNWKEATGPFNVYCNDDLVAENITVFPGNFRHLFFSAYLKTPERAIRLRFTGRNCSLNQLIVRNTIVEGEDYLFRRGFWNMPGLPEFGLTLDYTKTAPPPQMPLQTVLGRELTAEVTPVKAFASDHSPSLPAPMPPTDIRQEWAWNLKAGFIGTGNMESGFAFADEEELRSLCQKLKNLGYNAILEQGLFWYNSYSEATRLEHIRHQRWVNDIIHECGLKVIRHADGPGFNTNENGIAAMSSMIDVFPIDMGSLKSFQGIGCISNPKLRRQVFDLLCRYVKETDCDGVMIDEGIASSDPRCVCLHCREKFTRDTGCILPMPDEAREMFNKDNPLYARWRYWKQLQSGEFYLEMRKHLDKVKPGIIITNYGVDFQLPDGRTPMLAPYVEIVGTEGNGHHLLLNFRNLYANRKLIAAYGSKYQHPAWHSHIADKGLRNLNLTGYLYWAFNSLNRCGVMFFTDDPASEAGSTLNWQDRMDFRGKTTIADVAIFHRTDFRYDYNSPKPQRISEILGISQMLTDAHVPHDFLVSLDELENLQKYKVIFFGNIASLSDDELIKIQDYVYAGGKIIISGVFGSLDQLYRKASPDRFAKVSGVEYPEESISSATQLAYSFAGRKNTLLSGRVPQICLNAEKIGLFTDETAAITRNRYGQGVCITTPLSFGMYNYEENLFPGRPWMYRYDLGAAELLTDLLEAAEHTRYPVMTDRKIDKLLIESCQDVSDGKYYIQLLNLSTTVKAEYEKIPGTVDLDSKGFIQLDKPLKLIVAFPLSTAQAASQDFDGKRQLQLKKLADGTTEIVIPPELLKIYTLITAY